MPFVPVVMNIYRENLDLCMTFEMLLSTSKEHNTDIHTFYILKIDLLFYSSYKILTFYLFILL